MWEVKGAGLTISPDHLAVVGLVDSEKGISLRFPRFIGIREDKNPEDPTSFQQVREMFLDHKTVLNQREEQIEVDED